MAFRLKTFAAAAVALTAGLGTATLPISALGSTNVHTTTASSGSGTTGTQTQNKTTTSGTTPATGTQTGTTTESTVTTTGGDAESTTTAPATTTGDDEAPSGGTADDDAPQPALGQSVAAAAVDGTVQVMAKDGTLHELAAARALPTGTVLDTRHGTVALTSAVDAAGTTQTGRFHGALFEVRQSHDGSGMTELLLRGGDFSRCHTASGLRAAAASTRPRRTLWGSDHHGRFRTRGRTAVATVRGTRWETIDDCSGTETRVASGAVAVRDLVRHRTVLVRAGHSYLARVGR